MPILSIFKKLNDVDKIGRFLNAVQIFQEGCKRIINTIVIEHKILKIIFSSFALLYLPLSETKSKLAQRLNSASHLSPTASCVTCSNSLSPKTQPASSASGSKCER